MYENKIYVNFLHNRITLKIEGDWETFIIPIKNKIKSKYYRWDKSTKLWYKEFDTNLMNSPFRIKDRLKIEYEYLVDEFPVDIIDFTGIQYYLYKLKQELESKKQLINQNIEESLNNIPIHIKEKALKHQIEAVRRYNKQEKQLLLGWQMGTCKTLASLIITLSQKKKGLIIVPKDLIEQWEEEILKWNIVSENKIQTFDHKTKLLPLNCTYYIFNYEKFSFLSLEELNINLNNIKDLKNIDINQLTINLTIDEKTKLKKFRKMKKNKMDFTDEEELEYKLLRQKKNKELSNNDRKILHWLLNINHEDFILILDETYKIKNYKADIHKAFKYLRNRFNFDGIIALTGTPQENNMMEFYTILNFVMPYCITWDDMEKYFVYKLPDNPYVKIFRNLELFNKMATKVMYRVLKTEVLDDLPELIQEYRFVENSSHAHELKEKLKDDARSIFEIYTTLRVMDSYLEPSENLKRYNIVKDYFIEHNEKYNVLLNILEEIGNERVLIFTAYSKTMNWLVNKLKKEGYNVIGVDSNTKNKNDIKKDFINNKYQIVVATEVWARGIDLYMVDYEINFDFPLNPSNYAQRRDRIHRQGSTKAKTVISLISDIIERDIYDLVKNKIKSIEQTVEGIKPEKVLDAIAKKWGMIK